MVRGAQIGIQVKQVDLPTSSLAWSLCNLIEAGFARF